MSLADLQKTKDALAAVEAKIAVERDKYQEAVSELQAQKAELEAELAAGLRAELSALGEGEPTRNGRSSAPRGRIDQEKIVAVVRKNPDIAAGEILRLIDGQSVGITRGGLSQKLAGMTKPGGPLVKHGEKRGTRYRVADNT